MKKNAEKYNEGRNEKICEGGGDRASLIAICESLIEENNWQEMKM